MSRHETFPDYKTLEDLAFLQRMRGYIREHGWCRGHLARSDGSVCILGAGLQAAGVSALRTERHWFHDKAARDKAISTHQRTRMILGFGEDCEVSDWNDEKCQSVQDVYDLLDAAEARLLGEKP